LIPDLQASPPRYNVLGVGVHALDLQRATQLVVSAARERRGGYVCFCDVNSASCAQRDPAHKEALNRSFLTTPDGMPLVWLGRWAGHREVSRVYGPDLLEAVAAATANTELTHFFFGGGQGTAEVLSEKLRLRFPGLKIAGTYTPPFRPLNDDEFSALTDNLEQLRPNFFWVGLSTPKQERFMSTQASRLNVGLSLGVGAAFDFLSGRVRQAPRLVQRSGFEWLWRLSHEPRRLGARYLRNNPMFLLRIIGQLTGLRRYPQTWK
jgi:N-acetylglucosaminyldiphosphoundecaprenol N-acetyl-beta-D-mannosaminyltransferase